MLPKILQSIVGGYLGLSEAQVEALAQEAESVLGGVNFPEDSTPVRAYQSRSQLFAELNPRLEDIFTPMQQEKWDTFSPVWSNLAEGNRRRLTLGLARDDVDDAVVKGWTRHYRLSSEQQSQAQSLALDFRKEAEKLLQHHQFQGDWQDINKGEFQGIRDELLTLQLRYDQQITALLSPEQREQHLSSVPLIIRFVRGGTFDRTMDGNRGF